MCAKTHEICQERQDLEQQQSLEEKYKPIEDCNPIEENYEEGLPTKRNFGREEPALAHRRGVGGQRRQKSTHNGNVRIEI